MKVTNEQPFILNLHDREFPKIRELREKEFDLVTGGTQQRPGPQPAPPGGCVPPQEPWPTGITTPDGDGGDVIIDCTDPLPG